MLNSSRPQGGDLRVCTYRNVSTGLQIIRTGSTQHPTIERMVLPAQVITFFAHPDDELRVYTSDCATSVLAERIACQQLFVDHLESQVGVVY